MPRRDALVIEVGGVRFRFFYDRAIPGLLHIGSRHGTTPGEAIRAFFEGETRWNEARRRYETTNSTHTLYWARETYDGSVVVITCVRSGEE